MEEEQNFTATTTGSTSRGVQPIDVAPKQELLYSQIERLMKAFKTHRCALDFDRGFVHSELKSAKVEDE